MASCELFNNCPFSDERRSANGCGIICRTKYCRGDNADCARYMVFKALGAAAIPIDLYPDMHKRARQIIRNKSLVVHYEDQ